MAPLQPKEFLLYYAALILFSLMLFLRRKPRKGMRLRLRGSPRDTNQAPGRQHGDQAAAGVGGKQATEIYSHVQNHGERPLNVVFNYNGHSWDAYEVLGLPAGSSPENVEVAYRDSMAKLDDPSKPFMEAAYRAILAQWESFRKASGS